MTPIQFYRCLPRALGSQTCVDYLPALHSLLFIFVNGRICLIRCWHQTTSHRQILTIRHCEALGYYMHLKANAPAAYFVVHSETKKKLL